MRTLKKSVGLLLSLIILFGCFTIVPFDAGAQSVVVKTWAELVSAVNSRSAVVLGADITGGESDAFLQIAEGSEIVIDLNGCTLSRGAIGKDDPGYVFKIASNASLTVTDASGNDSGQITGGSSKHGGAFYNQGTLTIEGGSICNNYASDGGGAVCNNGTFNMSGGVIRDNVSSSGGAVYNNTNAVMTLSGTAKLTQNEATGTFGGAVLNYGKLTILDSAEISHNKAFTRGGAVWTGLNSTLELYGGVITENTAGIAGSGVYYHSGTVNMKGSPKIRLNDDDDLFLCAGKKINITGRLVPSYTSPGDYSNVGIITTGSDRVITSGYGQHNPDVTNPYLFFFSHDYHDLKLTDGELYAESYKTAYVYRYWDADAKKVRTGYDYAENVIDVSTLTDDVSVGMHSGNWYIVRGSVTITHRLNIVGTANLILGDGATLKCTDGIRSERRLNSVLNIYTQAEGSGRLIAESEARDWAAIGGHETGDAGTLNVYGGNITAKGLRSGIAGGTDVNDDGGAGGPVAIYGGEVHAEVTDTAASGAAIGGGNKAVACWKSGEGIVIYGGTVTAKAYYGAGIGNGTGKFSKSSGSIAIYGGKVTTEGETGIGGGCYNSNPRIDIHGGEVAATGTFGRTAGAGIGAGFNAGQGGSINISGGSVLAVGSSGAGIGGGYKGDGGTVNISGGAVVANAACKGAGIGGGGEGKGGTVSITGGIVHATSTTYDRTGELYNDVEKFFGGFAKISTTKSFAQNYSTAAALLLILGITAIVDYTRDNDVVGAGIGGGYDADGGNVSVSGNAIVYAKTDASAAAIGKGKKGDTDGSIDLWDDLMVLAGSSQDSLSRVNAGSREFLCRAVCVEIMPCDHQGADFTTDAYYHLSDCKWCKKHYAETHKYDSGGLKCTVCGYERILVDFDPNGGGNTMNSFYVTKGDVYNLPGCGFSAPEGKVFTGWSIGGSDELLPPNTPVSADNSVTLTANWSDYYGIYVNDTAVSENNKDDILGDGTVRFDSGSCALTLSHASIRNISAENIALTINGSGTVNNPDGNAIHVVRGLLTINGDFDIAASDMGIKVEGSGSKTGRLTLAGGNIGINAGYRGISTESGLFICNEIDRLEITVTANTGKAISAYNSLYGKFIIEEELYIKEPENAVILDSNIIGNPRHVIIEPKYVTVRFDPSGAEATGEYAMEPVVGKQTNTIVLPECAFKTPDGKVFESWLSGGKAYAPGDEYTLSEDVTFTAVWKNESCTLTFHSNLGEDETVIFLVPYGENFIIPDNEFDYPDDMLVNKRWKEDPVSEAKLHKFGAIITVTDDMDFYGMYHLNHTHSLEPVEAVAPTCEKRGNIAHWRCSSCKKCYADEQAAQRLSDDDIYISATGHTPGEPVRESEFPPAIGVDGSFYSVVYCSVCGKELSREQIVIPMTAVPYVDEKGAGHTCEEYTLLTAESDTLSGWVVAAQSVINHNRLTVSGNVDLILCDGAALTAHKGITVNEDATLTIWQQQGGTGALDIDAVDLNIAAIGGDDSPAGDITINGGVITVMGGARGAGIGGAYTENGGDIVINNGTVNATGGSNAAGIGGGSDATSGTVTINGGTVNTTGGYSGAAIGSGNSGNLENVTINGGIVNAAPSSFGTGIGGGEYGGGGTVDINGGAVTVTNVLNSKGIGAGTGGVNTTVTLNWTEDTKDTMSVISYRGYSGTVKLNRPFEDKNSGTVFFKTAKADNTKLSGKTLTPYTKLFTGHSLTLNGDIGVNFFLNLTDEQAAKTTVSFNWFDKSLNDIPVEEVDGSPGIYRVSCPVAVAEMTYDITATVKINNVVQEETDTYKVVSYANVILNNQTFISDYTKEHGAQKYQKLSTLVKTMLDYGAKAQERFDRDKNNPANGGEDFFTDPVTIENNADDMTAELEACGLTYVGSSVIYLSQTTLRHYYKITEPDKFTQQVKNGITFDGRAASYGERGGMIYFDKKDIAAPQLDTEYVIRINGNDYHYAVLDYIARAYNDESASPIEKELAAAVCRYHAAADAYFGN